MIRIQMEADETFKTSCKRVSMICYCVQGFTLAHKTWNEGIIYIERIALGRKSYINRLQLSGKYSMYTFRVRIDCKIPRITKTLYGVKHRIDKFFIL